MATSLAPASKRRDGTGTERTGHLPWRYVLDPYRYRRRPTRVVMVGSVGVGGQNPIRIQSMTTTDTMDTDATVAQVVRLVRAGCEIVRITAPTVEDARNLGVIRRELRAKGIRVPLVADIHFSPAAAMEAADHVEKVRINPGNFADSKRFAVREYTDEDYQAELSRIEERFAPLVEKCKARGIAMRIGTNHGSLSDRIMNRFGDTPLGMVESALEFARICHKYGYHDLIFSMKASNPKVMIQAYRLLAARLDELGWNYPFHLGVTEAGNGEDGRIKSAIGIGSLLEDGIGDTIRVSLTEDPEYEVPVAFALARPYQPANGASPSTPPSAASPDTRGLSHDAGPDGRQQLSDGLALPDTRDPYRYTRRASRPVAIGPVTIGSGQVVRVVHTFSGPLSGVPDAPARALALATADGLMAARPDALAVQVEEGADLAALASLRAALDAAQQELPLVVEAPAATTAGSASAIARSAAALALRVGGEPPAGLRAALEAIAATRRPVLLVATPPPRWEDMAAAASEMVDRLLGAVLIAEAAGCRDVVVSARVPVVGLAVRAYRLLSARLAEREWDLPIHLIAQVDEDGLDAAEVLLRASVLLGSVLCDGIGDSIQLVCPPARMDDAAQARLAFNLLQGAGVRLSKTEFVACPSCGRTLFDLQETTTRIQRKTGHLKGVKIAIMGCIVNGPGEMADADFGYVGGAPGKVNLYVGKECVEKGVPAAVADERLIALIRSRGRWVDPPAPLEHAVKA